MDNHKYEQDDSQPLGWAKNMEVLIPILLSLMAGLATGIGGLIVLALGEITDRMIGFLMGFAGGVMLIVSFINLYYEALSTLTVLQVAVSFTIGASLMMIIDLKLPHIEFGEWETGIQDRRLFNSGIIIAIGMSLHNLPEGIVISAGYTHKQELGYLVALMISLHNIPEGIATVTPLIQSGMKKWRAVGLATLSGLMEPIGAIIGIGILLALGGGPVLTGYGLSFASGVMIYVTIDELIPIAHEYCTDNNKHIVSTGLLTGLIFAQLVSILI